MARSWQVFVEDAAIYGRADMNPEMPVYHGRAAMATGRAPGDGRVDLGAPARARSGMPWQRLSRARCDYF